MREVLLSAYRALHSTETTLLHLFNHTIVSLDSGNVCLLSLFDSSAAVDTFDHDRDLKSWMTKTSFSSMSQELNLYYSESPLILRK